MSKPPIIEIDHMDFFYTEQKPLFRDLCFSLNDGEKIGLYGPNGCGKTTFFRLLTGLAKARKGRVLFRGDIVGDESQWRTLRCSVGFVLQHAEDQLFCPTVLEDVAFGPLNLGLAPEKAKERAMATLKALGLEGFENRLTHKLSGGEKKLVSLAAVMSMRPDALLLDEPTNGLDPDARARLVSILKNSPTARITISHDWDFLTKTSNSFMTVAEGKLTAAGPKFFHAHTHAHVLGNIPHEHSDDKRQADQRCPIMPV